MDPADSPVDHFAADASVPLPQGPVRTCVGCRARDSATGLLRVVAMRADVVSDAALVRLVSDHGRRAVGRGAWLHVNQECLALALRRRAFGRALRVAGAIDPTLVGEYVTQQAPNQHHATPHAPAPVPTANPKAERTNEHSMKLPR